MRSTLQSIIELEGALVTRRHPTLRNEARRLVSRGALLNPLPGVFIPADADPALAWLRAVNAWFAPLGAFHDSAALAIWLGQPLPQQVTVTHPTLRSRGRVVVSRRVPPSHQLTWRSGLRLVTPAFSAVERCGEDKGESLTQLLRQGLLRPDDLPEAVAALKGSAGQRARAAIAQACAANPWSWAEARLHQILIGAGITGWVANPSLIVNRVRVCPDILFPEAGLVIEFDGRAYHSDAAAFRADRERQNLLASNHYVVLRFVWEHLDDPGYVVATVKAARDSLSRYAQ